MTYREIYNKISDKLLEGYNLHGTEFGNIIYEKLIKHKNYGEYFKYISQLNRIYQGVYKIEENIYLDPLTIFSLMNIRKDRDFYFTYTNNQEINNLINKRIETFFNILSIPLEPYNFKIDKIEYGYSYENTVYELNERLNKKDDETLILIWDLFKKIKNNEDIPNLGELDKKIYRNSYRDISCFAYLINPNYLPITKFIEPLLSTSISNITRNHINIKDYNIIENYNKIKDYCIELNYDLSTLIFKKNLASVGDYKLTKEEKDSLKMNNNDVNFFNFINKTCNSLYKEKEIVLKKDFVELGYETFFEDLINNEIKNDNLIKVSKKWIVIKIQDEYCIDGIDIDNILMIPNKKDLNKVDSEVDLKLYDNINEFNKNESKLLKKDDFEIKFKQENDIKEFER